MATFAELSEYIICTCINKLLQRNL